MTLTRILRLRKDRSQAGKSPAALPGDFPHIKGIHTISPARLRRLGRLAGDAARGAPTAHRSALPAGVLARATIPASIPPKISSWSGQMAYQ